MIGVADRNPEFARKLDESGRREGFAPRLDDMADFHAVEFLRQQFQKLSEIRFVEFLCGRELPEQGAQFVA